MDWAVLGLFIVSIAVLVASGSILVRFLNNISRYLKLSEFVVGFVIMALATSLPEVLVGIQSALSGAMELSLGNVFGSNIVNLTLVIGMALLLGRGITIHAKATQQNVHYMVVFAVLPLLLAWDLRIGRIDAIILLSGFLWYIHKLYMQQKVYHKTESDVTRRQFVVSCFGLVAGTVLLVLSAQATVHYATALASLLGVPLYLVGIILLAFGTSLPELVFEARAVTKGHKEMALGGLYGSVVFNATFVLGITALISPIIITSAMSLLFSGLFLVFTLVLFSVFVNNDKLSWQEGFVLVLLYIVFAVVQVNLGFVPVH